MAKYELGKEIGRRNFSHTCRAKGKKGRLKNQPVAVKIISKAKMTTAISIEDVRREVKILTALSIRMWSSFMMHLRIFTIHGIVRRWISTGPTSV